MQHLPIHPSKIQDLSHKSTTHNHNETNRNERYLHHHQHIHRSTDTSPTCTTHSPHARRLPFALPCNTLLDQSLAIAGLSRRLLFSSSPHNSQTICSVPRHTQHLYLVPLRIPLNQKPAPTTQQPLHPPPVPFPCLLLLLLPLPLPLRLPLRPLCLSPCLLRLPTIHTIPSRAVPIRIESLHLRQLQLLA